ncbi:methyl-accepting chemotaxis protein [Chitinimonas koreensis]|uniref:methyl-accepting chemotaxis protein n=1 Tax=Chitinimonas koreensis TaxID=356302 RepID=UPI00040F02A6|nr:methyl-accepting chemotaxis protein [Chitinimonas koreensis]QNM96956.1 methyl-accepting chemotaxis protein [Chitinimonas koreensis]
MTFFARLSLQLKLQLAFLAIALLSIGTFTIEAVYQARQSAMAEVDGKLAAAARAYVYILGADYHDKLAPRESADLAAKRREAERLTEASRFLGVKYLYSFILRGEQVIYAQASLSDEQMADPKFEFYLKPSDVPDTDPIVRKAAQTGQPQFISSSDPVYGYLRTIALPVTGPGGTAYVACADVDANAVDAAVNGAVLKAVLTGLAMLAAAVVVSLLLGRLIAQPLRRLRDMMQALTTGNGDLTIRLPVQSQDEIGQIAVHVNTFMAQLQQMFTTVSQETVKLTNGVRSIDQMAQRLSKDADLQSEMATATAATIEEITVSINHIADSTTDADALVRRTGQMSEDSARTVEEVAAEIGRVAGYVDELSGVMGELDNRSQQISSIVGVIRDISDQTNLLALNAAIEAARAGEQGRGFAVVADEVRKLAERTGNATVEIGQMIGAMRAQSQQALGHMGSTHAAVRGGAEMATGASQQIRGIRQQMQEVVARIQEIAHSANEQSTATTEMAKAAERISVMAQDGNLSLREARAVIEDLNGLAGELRQMIGRFKL